MAKSKNQDEHDSVKTRVLSNTQKVIHTLLNEFDEFFDCFSMPSYTGSRRIVHVPKKEWDMFLEEKKNKRAVYNLRQSKWLKDQQKGDEVIFEISTDAIVSVLKSVIRDKGDILKDDQMCLVMFDVPNGANAARTAWRRYLVKCGFKQLQRSVWYSPLDVATELSYLTKLLKIDSWVIVFVGKIQNQ